MPDVQGTDQNLNEDGGEVKKMKTGSKVEAQKVVVAKRESLKKNSLSWESVEDDEDYDDDDDGEDSENCNRLYRLLTVAERSNSGQSRAESK